MRQKAKDISNLLLDEGRLREERRSRAHMRDRMIGGIPGGDGEADDDEDENRRRRSHGTASNGRRPNKEEDDIKRALEESKRSLAAEQAKQGGLTAEEADLLRAIQLSEEEERKRDEAVAKSNQSALFDDLALVSPFTHHFSANSGMQRPSGHQPSWN